MQLRSYCAAHTVWLKSDLWKGEVKNNNSETHSSTKHIAKSKTIITNYYLTHQAAACEDINWESALCYKQQQQTIWLDEWVSSWCADKVPCNKSRNQVQSNFAVDLAGFPDSGEGTKAPGLIHLSPDRVIQKIWGKDGGWADRKGGMGAFTGCQLG